MNVEQVERQLREQLEAHVGRRLSDDEWETFKRIQQKDMSSRWSEGDTAARRCTLRATPFWIAVLVLASAGVAMLLEWDVVFSPIVRIPLGVFMLLIGLTALGIWVAGIFRGRFRGDFEGFWGWVGWVAGLWFVPVGLVSIGAEALSHQSRTYWTSPLSDANVGIDTPAKRSGLVFILASILLAWVGRPTRSSSH